MDILLRCAFCQGFVAVEQVMDHVCQAYWDWDWDSDSDSEDVSDWDEGSEEEEEELFANEQLRYLEILIDAEDEDEDEDGVEEVYYVEGHLDENFIPTVVEEVTGRHRHFDLINGLFNLDMEWLRYGWLLLFTDVHHLVFFNPFTCDIIELPEIHLQCCCFSAPPTSPDCMVVGFLTHRLEETTTIFFHSVGQEPHWSSLHLDLHSIFFMFPTFCGRDVYVLSNEGGLHVFKVDDLSFETVVAKPPRSCCKVSTEYFLVKCDQHGLLLVVVGDFGKSVEVFKLKEDSSTKEWEKMDDLGRHVIYISDTTRLCMDAKTPEMENKIFFPLLHVKNENMTFYSLKTHRYHTFNSRNSNEDLRDVFETKYKLSVHAWIEPSWVKLA